MTAGPGAPHTNGSPNGNGRKDAERRLTFTQSPYTHRYASELSELTGLPKSHLYNQAMLIMAVLVRAHRHGQEFCVRDTKSGRVYSDPALAVMLGDILTSLPEGMDEQR